MHYISDRAARLEHNLIESENKLLSLEIRDKENALELDDIINPYPPSPKAIEAMKDAVNNDLRFYPDSTYEKLTRAIAAHEGVDADMVFVGNGSDEVLSLAFFAFFEQNREILFPEISYNYYRDFAMLHGLKFRNVPLSDSFEIMTADYADAEGGIVITNPNEPTAIMTDVEKLKEIVENNKKNVVIVDETFIEFADRDVSRNSMVSYTKAYENLLIVRSFSVSMSLAGMRVGYAIGNKDLIECLRRVQASYNPYNVNVVAEAGAIAALEDEEHYDLVRKKIINTRDWVTEELRDLGYEVTKSATGFLFLTIPLVKAAKIHTFLQERGILVSYSDEPVINRYIRVTLGTDHQMRRLVDALREFAEQLVSQY